MKVHSLSAGIESVTVGGNNPLSSIFCYFPAPVESRPPQHFMRSNPGGLGTSFGLMPGGCLGGMVTLGID